MPRLSEEAKLRRKDNKRVMERYRYYRDKGICPMCGREDAAIGHIYCQSCIDKKKQQEEKRDPGHVNRIVKKRLRYLDRIAKGLCTDCGKPTNNGYKRCDRCLEKNRMNYRLYDLKKRLAEEKRKRGINTP